MLESFSRCSRWILEKATIICFRFYSLCWIDRTKSTPVSCLALYYLVYLALHQLSMKTDPWRILRHLYHKCRHVRMSVFDFKDTTSSIHLPDIMTGDMVTWYRWRVWSLGRTVFILFKIFTRASNRRLHTQEQEEKYYNWHNRLWKIYRACLHQYRLSCNIWMCTTDRQALICGLI